MGEITTMSGFGKRDTKRTNLLLFQLHHRDAVIALAVCTGTERGNAGIGFQLGPDGSTESAGSLSVDHRDGVDAGHAGLVQVFIHLNQASSLIWPRTSISGLNSRLTTARYCF